MTNSHSFIIVFNYGLLFQLLYHPRGPRGPGASLLCFGCSGQNQPCCLLCTLSLSCTIFIHLLGLDADHFHVGSRLRPAPTEPFLSRNLPGHHQHRFRQYFPGPGSWWLARLQFRESVRWLDLHYLRRYQDRVALRMSPVG